MATEIGTAGIITQGARVTFGPLGYERIYKEQGNHATMLARATVLKDAGWSGSVNPIEGSPKSNLEAWVESADASGTLTSNPIATDYNFETDSAQVVFTQAQEFKTQFAALLSADPVLAALWDEVWRGVAAITDIGSSALATLLSTYPYLYHILYLKEGGESGYFRAEPGLEVIDRYQHIATPAIPVSTINKAYNPSSLIALFTTPTRTVNQMPSHIQTAITTLGGQYLSTRISYQTSSEGSRVMVQGFRWAPYWNENIYTIV